MNNVSFYKASKRKKIICKVRNISIAKKPFFLIVAYMLACVCMAKTNVANCDYSIAGVAIGKEGTYLVEVSAVVDKKKEATIDIVKKCALHGCLYKGFVVDRISQSPLLSSPVEQEQTESLDKLLNEQFNMYIISTQPVQIVKVGKRYRVTAIVSVAKERLRKDLEKAGVVRKLGL